MPTKRYMVKQAKVKTHLCKDCKKIRIPVTRQIKIRKHSKGAKEVYKTVRNNTCNWCDQLRGLGAHQPPEKRYRVHSSTCEVCNARIKTGITGHFYCPNGHSHKNIVTKELVIDQPVSPSEGHMTLQDLREVTSAFRGAQ